MLKGFSLIFKSIACTVLFLALEFQYYMYYQRPIFNNPVDTFSKENVSFFPLENQNDPIFQVLKLKNSNNY